MTLDADVKGDAYEGLLAKNAEDIKSGAGQYFTPRPLIQAIVDVMRPTAGDAGVRPGGGTGGFLLAAHEKMRAEQPTRTRSGCCAMRRSAAGRSSTRPPGCAR